jgi:polyhydroxybutyrate depolymerase
LDVSDANGFLLLAPNGVNVETGDTYGDKQNWSDMRVLDNPENTLPINDDLGFIEQLIQYAVATHNINPSKVYTTGSSNGGIMTYTLLLKKPQLFAAGAAFIANLPTVTIVKPDKTVPIMIMNGNKDRLMKWDGGDLRSDVGGNVRSALATRDWWLQNNLASTTNVAEIALPNRNLLDRCRIRGEFYPPNVDDAATTSNATALTPAPVHFYTMDGGGHSMPIRRGFFNLRQNLYDLLLSGPSCHDVDGAVVAWEFLSSYTL